MNCSSCADRGVFAIAYHDGSPQEYAICLCPAGEAMRQASNQGHAVTPQWQVWAFCHGIALEHVGLMEDLLTPEELAAAGFVEISAPADALGAIAAAARKRSAKTR